MTSQPAQPEPPRLLAERDSLGLLLGRSEQAFRAGLAEGPAWQRFQQRTRRRRWMIWLVPGLACSVALLAEGWRARTNEPAAVTVTAERIAPRASIPEVTPAKTAATSTTATDTATPSPERRIPSAPPPFRSAHPSELKIAPVSSPTDDATCRRWSSEGKREEAAQCFEAVGEGSGLGAQVALYQAARLSSEVLHDAPRALALLERHQRRFPGGPLRIEVEWLRVQNLERVGQLEQALSASEALLATPSGRVLGSKLHLLRGRIYAKAKGDCAHALSELVALLGEPGAEGDEGELERAQCLEQLARTDEARTAYERYTRRANARHLAFAEQRLIALGAGPKPQDQAQ